MVERQLLARGIHRQDIVAAFLAVPREKFVDSEFADRAYGDYPLPIEAGQTISQPYIVALMIDAANVRSGDRVLEVGAGSGYAAAVLGRIAAQVVGIERHGSLVQRARDRLAKIGAANVEIVEGDGTLGWPDGAPYDAILVSASGSHPPPALIDQLAPGGRLVMPVGAPEEVQRLLKLTKRPDGDIEREELGAVRFVPLIGTEGWEE